MIDTDKYEGHTTQGWRRPDGSTYPALRATNNADAELMADAPLLLEEVKRLREQYTELREALIGDSPNWTHEELIEFTIKALGMIE
tara:strand:- start:210 stop:467 length:258 start_codon:yes stop_codon:yes gene_type:complete